jgi:iron-sulfur cluster assembly protein
MHDSTELPALTEGLLTAISLPMSISLTSAAADRVRSFLGRRGHGVGLRLSVKKTGCSGFAYVVNYADEIAADDVVFEDHGVKVIVDRDSLGYIDGTEVDFVKQGLNEAFRFRNPNVKGECGCGESFTV